MAGTVEPQTLHLTNLEAAGGCEGGGLADAPGTGEATYTYDPGDPVPTHGGAGMLAYRMPGYGGARTGIFVTELTPEALFDAYRNRRIFATQGYFAFIDFRVSGAFMGSETEVHEAPHITAIIDVPDPFDFVEVIRDGEVIHWAQPDGAHHEIDFVDETADAGEHFYFLRIKMIGDPGLAS